MRQIEYLFALGLTGRPAARRRLGGLGVLDGPAPRGRRRGRRDDRANVAIGRVVEIDDDRGVVAWPAALARLAVDPRGAHARRDGRPPSTRSMRTPRSWWNIPAR